MFGRQNRHEEGTMTW